MDYRGSSVSLPDALGSLAVVDVSYLHSIEPVLPYDLECTKICTIYSMKLQYRSYVFIQYYVPTTVTDFCRHPCPTVAGHVLVWLTMWFLMMKPK